MKVSLLASPKSLETRREELFNIFSLLEELGHKHTTDFLKSIDISNFYSFQEDSSKKSLDQIEKALKEADVCIFDTTVQSLGLGHLIYMAHTFSKPIIALYQGNNRPQLLSDIDNESIQIQSYTTIDDLRKTLEHSLAFAKDQVDTRFNFFISPKHSNYLDWIAKNKRIARSVYLRSLIKKDMDKNEEYLS